MRVKDKLKLDCKAIDKAILEIKELQIKYRSEETIFIYHALSEALNTIGWSYAKLLEDEELKEKELGNER